MIKPRIKYFSYRGCAELERLRKNSPAADTKINYIIETLNNIGYSVDHISAAESSTGKFISGYVQRESENTFRYFASFGINNKLIRLINRWFIQLQFFLWCLINIKKDERILVYHSLGYDSAFIKLKKLKNIRIIGDIEEIYQDVSKQKPSQERNEYTFVDICDKYMFPNTILNELLNKTNKPYLIVHGVYKVNDHESISYNDGKIHVLYAGTYDPNKGGALASVKAAEFLSDKYHLHITGFGSRIEEDNIKSEIEKVKQVTKCNITFHGFLNDVDFLDLMQRCSIGLCTQDPTSKLNLTSFPSKILNYMANGLVVLSGRNRVIENSAVGDIVYYYESQDPKVMAKSIMAIQNPNLYNTKSRLYSLNKEFQQNLKNYLSF